MQPDCDLLPIKRTFVSQYSLSCYCRFSLILSACLDQIKVTNRICNFQSVGEKKSESTSVSTDANVRRRRQQQGVVLRQKPQLQASTAVSLSLFPA